ncbi:MAG: V-type ATPase 116kDa subunit family protein [Acidilobaceae archaeon]
MLTARRLEEVIVVVPKRKYDAVIARLATEGIFHVEEPTRDISGSISSKFKSLYIQASERVSRVHSYFSILRVEPSLEPGLNIEVSDWVEAFNRSYELYRELDKFFEVRVSRLSEMESKIQELNRIKSLLEAIKGIDVDIRVAIEGLRLQLALGVGPASLESDVEHLAKTYGVIASIEKLSKDTLLIGIAGRQDVMRVVVTTLLRKGFTLIIPPRELPGKPSEAYKTVTLEIENLLREAERIRESLLSRIGELRRFYTYMYAFREIFKIITSTLETNTMTILRGYIDINDKRRLERILGEETNGSYLLISLKALRGEARIPTKVSLPRIIQPFHNIVRLYGEPSPEEIVPTLFLAITFPLSFALMFPDLGHGLLLILFAYIYLRKRSPDWSYIFTILGFAAMLTGIMAGEFFGPIPAELIHLPAIWSTLGLSTPPLALPTYAVEHGLEELIGELLYRAVSISLWMAAFMLTLGSLLGVINSYMKSNFEDLLSTRLPKLIFFASVTSPFLLTFDARRGGSILGKAILELGGGDIFATIILILIVISLLWMLSAEPIISILHGHFSLSSFAKSLMEVYETILMATGNIPSFLRIMALAMAHSSVMLSFAFIFEMFASLGVAGLIIGIIAYIIGNLIVVALEGILAFAHSLRLHFYEWFSKFYTGTGIPFTPISIPEVKVIIIRTT